MLSVTCLPGCPFPVNTVKGGHIMDMVKCRLTVLFKDSLWIGVYEREWKGQYEAAKIIFGAEPKDY